MVANAYRESHFDTGAINPDCWPGHINPQTGYPYICAGILQVIESNVADWHSLLDPDYCVRESYRLWLNSPSNPWRTE